MLKQKPLNSLKNKKKLQTHQSHNKNPIVDLLICKQKKTNTKIIKINKHQIKTMNVKNITQSFTV